MFEIIMSIPISYFSFLGCNTRVSMVVIPGDVSNDPSCSENNKKTWMKKLTLSRKSESPY